MDESCGLHAGSKVLNFMSMLGRSKVGNLIRAQDPSNIQTDRGCRSVEICRVLIVMPCPDTPCSLRQIFAGVLVGLAWDSSATSGVENKDPVRLPYPFSLTHDVGEE